MVDRLRKHLSNHKGYTSKAKDWEVVYTKEYANRSLAYALEREVKGWKSKVRVIQLISN